MVTAALSDTASRTPGALRDHLCSVRQQSLSLCEPLTPEDMMVQSCPEASPAKWHLAHTSWFFETFVLREFLPGYKPFHPDFVWLFNSYYNAVSSQPQKKLRASFSRPSLESILAYRSHVDAALNQLFEISAPEEAERRLILGLHHEQQHGELLLYDIKHAFWSNPLRPAYREGGLPGTADASGRRLSPQGSVRFPEGLQEIGHPGGWSSFESFCFDNEEPRHRIWLDSFELAQRPVSCAEYLQFMQDGGYRRAELWLSDGWEAVQREGWQSPLYWHRETEEGEWTIFTLRGDQPLRNLLPAPVCHISYYEAEAFARWAGMQLPTEGEWEVAAAGSTPEISNLLEGDTLHPLATTPSDGLREMFGGVWEWTGSAYLGYPGYSAAPGALGEYNGKFMSNQMVLRGGSVATPFSHIRGSYRNFFGPHTRWQFSGVRLARRSY